MLFNKQLMGLDLGSRSIKVAKMVKRKNGYHLKKFGIVPIPVNTVVDGSIMNTYEMNDAVKTLLAKTRIKDKMCAIGIAGHGIISRLINMPKVSEEDFVNALRVEAETHVPHDIGEIYYDGIRTGFIENNKERVLLVAARQDLVGDFVQVVYESGVKPISVEIDSTALANLFEINYPEERSNTVAILNIGASKINVVVVSKGLLSFFRDIAIGGNFITEEVSKKLNVSFQQAESLKSGEESTEDSILPQDVERVVSESAKAMAADINRVFDYYSNINADEIISKVYVTGGTTKSHTFMTALQSQLDFEVEKLEPFKEIAVSGQLFTSEELDEYSHVASVSLGLALRRLDE